MMAVFKRFLDDDEEYILEDDGTWRVADTYDDENIYEAVLALGKAAIMNQKQYLIVDNSPEARAQSLEKAVLVTVRPDGDDFAMFLGWDSISNKEQIALTRKANRAARKKKAKEPQ